MLDHTTVYHVEVLPCQPLISAYALLWFIYTGQLPEAEAYLLLGLGWAPSLSSPCTWRPHASPPTWTVVLPVSPFSNSREMVISGKRHVLQGLFLPLARGSQVIAGTAGHLFWLLMPAPLLLPLSSFEDLLLSFQGGTSSWTLSPQIKPLSQSWYPLFWCSISDSQVWMLSYHRGLWVQGLAALSPSFCLSHSWSIGFKYLLIPKALSNISHFSVLQLFSQYQWFSIQPVLLPPPNTFGIVFSNQSSPNTYRYLGYGCRLCHSNQDLSCPWCEAVLSNTSVSASRPPHFAVILFLGISSPWKSLLCSLLLCLQDRHLPPRFLCCISSCQFCNASYLSTHFSSGKANCNTTVWSSSLQAAVYYSSMVASDSSMFQ